MDESDYRDTSWQRSSRHAAYAKQLFDYRIHQQHLSKAEAITQIAEEIGIVSLHPLYDFLNTE